MEATELIDPSEVKAVRECFLGQIIKAKEFHRNRYSPGVWLAARWRVTPDELEANGMPLSAANLRADGQPLISVVVSVSPVGFESLNKAEVHLLMTFEHDRIVDFYEEMVERLKAIDELFRALLDDPDGGDGLPLEAWQS